MKTVLTVSLKGGTGKSMISSFLAKYSSEKGNTILIDADLDSPNLAEIFKVEKDLEIKPNYIEVAHLENMDFFSMGLIAKGKPISMSGDSYVQILLDLLAFGDWNIDKENALCIIDCPAGAGDIFRYTLRAFADTIVGAIVVGIPQTYMDLDRIIKILKHYNVPILGVVENMSYFKCECGRTYDFSRTEFDEIIKNHNVEFFGKIPISPEIKDTLSLGIPVIPEEVEEIIEKIYEKSINSKPAGKGILAKLSKKVSGDFKKKLGKMIINAIIRINKEIDLKSIENEGFGGNVIEFIITDKGEPISRVYLKIKDGKLVVVKNPKEIDISTIVEIDTIIDLSKGKITLEDAFYFGDIEVSGVGGAVRAMSFFKNFYKVIENESTKIINKVI